MNFSGTLSLLIKFGGTGVHAFIFISGFGLYLSSLKKPLSYVSFLKRRFTKIYFPYIIIVLISAFLSLFLPIYNNSLYALLGHIFLYKMFDETIIGSYGYQLWFISTIIQFYIVFPLLVRLKKATSDKYFIAVGLIISICWATMIYNVGVGEMRVWGSCFLQLIWEFMLGMVCAERFYKRGSAFWEQKKIVLLIITVVAVAIYALMAMKFGVFGHVFNDFPALFGFVAFALLAFSLNIVRLNNFMLFTAKIGYPLFLIHILVLLLVQAACKHYNLPFSWVTSIITFALCYIASMLTSRGFKAIGVL